MTPYKNLIDELRSKCCNGMIEASTACYICLKCGKPCDPDYPTNYNMKKEKKIKAWACLDSSGNIAVKSDDAPRIYATEKGAKKVADVVVTGAAKLKVVPVQILWKSKK